MRSPPAFPPLDVPYRLLLGPGPSPVSPEVLRAMSTPLVGHLDPEFLAVMSEVQELLRYVFQTDNRWTIPVSGTGSAAMEAAFANLVRPGDTVLVPTNGYFGGRMASMAERAGGEVAFVEAAWGEPLDPAEVARALETHRPDVFGFVHAETSTGVLQPDVPGLTSLAHEAGAVVIVDAVTSLGGVELRVDDWDIDVAYSGAQKCLSCPPGASPLTLSDAAFERIRSRPTPARSWYLDVGLLESYWGEERSYHHTAPITNVFALREALRQVAEEGLEARWERHRTVAGALVAGACAMGLSLLPASDSWLPSLNAIEVPDGIDSGRVTRTLLTEYGIEIAGGLGDLKGRIFRIGCMGHGCRPSNVLLLLSSLGEVLAREGAAVDPAAGLAAAHAALSA